MSEEKEVYDVTIKETTPATVLDLAIEKGASLEQLEKFMELKIKWEEREAKKAYHEAMAAFKLNPPDIEKDKTVSYNVQGKGTTTYKHATLANVTSKINAGLSKHGLSAAWETKQTNGTISVICKITHILGHSEETTLTASPDLSGSKNAIQAIGSSISYLQRYTLLALAGLATHDMDDDGAGSEPVYITEKQVSDITTMIDEKAVDKVKFLVFMKAESLETIPASDYNKAIASLKAKKTGRVPGQEG